MRFRGSLATRVALLTTVAVALAVALLSTAAYLTVQRQLYSSLDSALLSRAEGAASSTALSALLEADFPSSLLGAADIQIAVLFADGTFESGQAKGAAAVQLTDAELAVARGQSPQSMRTAFSLAGPYRVAAVPGKQRDTALVVAQSLGPTRDTLSKLGFVLTLFGIFGVVFAGLLGRAIATNGLTPVRRLTDAVEGVGRTENLAPIPVEGGDEIARLAAAFNATLAAVSAARDRQRQLVADAGHELRTPLTSLRTNVELLTQAETRGGLSSTSRTELMGDISFQIAELTTLIGDLTELARDDQAPATLELLDLAEVVDRAVDRVRRRASSLHFDVQLEQWWVSGEMASLERAITNLLDNAAKWSPPLGVITVRLAEGTLYVADQGPGIAEEDLPHVFERFYRSPESRAMPGSGLGLAIVSTIVERHDGQVKVGRAEEGGAGFWLRLPGESEVPDSHQHALSADSASPDTLAP